MIAWMRYPLVGACSAAVLLLFGCAGKDGNKSIRRDRPISQPSNEDNPEASAFATDILPQTYMAAGRLHESQGKLALALEQYQLAIKTEPKYVEAYNRIGIVLDRMSHFKEADRVFLKAIELAPKLPHLHNNLGFSYTMQLRWQEAEQALHKAIGLKPDFIRARINLAMVLAQQSRFDQAFTHFRAGLPLADAYYNIGLMYQSKGMATEAARAYKAALKRNPELVAAQKRLEKLPKEVARAARPFTIEEMSPPPVAVTVEKPVSPIIEPEPAVIPAETVTEPPSRETLVEKTSPTEPAPATNDFSTLEQEKIAALLAASEEEAEDGTPTTQPANDTAVAQAPRAPEPVVAAEPVDEPAPEPVAAFEPADEPAPEPVVTAEPVDEPVSEPVVIAEPENEPADEPKLPDVLCLTIQTNTFGRTTGSHLEPDWRLFTAQGAAIDSVGRNDQTTGSMLLPVSRSKQENNLQSLKMASRYAMQLLKSMTRPISRFFAPVSPTKISRDQLSSPDLPLTPLAAKTADTPGYPVVSRAPAQ